MLRLCSQALVDAPAPLQIVAGDDSRDGPGAIEVTDTMVRARLPRFDYAWKDDKTLVIEHKSRRQMVDVNVGLVGASERPSGRAVRQEAHAGHGGDHLRVRASSGRAKLPLRCRRDLAPSRESAVQEIGPDLARASELRQRR